MGLKLRENTEAKLVGGSNCPHWQGDHLWICVEMLVTTGWGL